MLVASSDYNEDIRISREILTRLSEAYRKIRNTARFILSNLYDFNPDTDKAEGAGFREIDKWIIAKAAQLVKEVKDAYGTSQNPGFEFHKAYKLIYDFCNIDLSMYYLDMVKGRLYTAGAASAGRRAAQTVIYEVLGALTRLMAPILVFTAEEIWQHMPKERCLKDRESVHLLGFPDEDFFVLKAEKLAQNSSMVTAALELIPAIAKALEEKRAQGEIGSSFDAQINLLTKDQIRYNFLTSLGAQLAEIFKVSAVSVGKADAGADFSVEVKKAGGAKCVRCWNYSTDVGSFTDHPLICANCRQTVA